MMFIDERVETTCRILDDLTQPLVDLCALVTHLVENGLQDDDIFDDVFFEHIDLVEHDVGVEQEIVWLTDDVAGGLGYFGEDDVVLFVRTNDADGTATPQIGAEIMLSDDLKR